MRLSRSIILTAMLGLTALGLTAPVFAGTNDGAVIALHPEPRLAKSSNPCEWDSTSCQDDTRFWPAGTGTDLFLLVARGNPAHGIAAMSCGISYGPNLAVSSWTLCASGLQFPNDGGNGEWPASLGGNRITWDNTVDCQITEIGRNGVHALAGRFYVYAYGQDLFAITPNNNLQSGPEYQVGDCSGSITDLLTPFAALGFGGIGGTNPCDAVPVKTTSWGTLKTTY